MTPDRVLLPGSERHVSPGHQKVGPVPQGTASVTLYLRQRPDAPSMEWLDEAVTAPYTERPRIDRQRWADEYGASEADLVQLAEFAVAYGLEVGEVHIGRRSMVIRGEIAALAEAFSANLGMYVAPDGTQYRGRTGPLRLPRELAPIVCAVLGLDEGRQAKPHVCCPPAGTAVGYSPAQVASLYSFPSAATGAGQRVALIELGGGYSQDDVEAFFAAAGIRPPIMSWQSVDGALNQPGSQHDIQVALDIQTLGAVAPGCEIAVYFAPNTSRGFLDAVTTALHDNLRRPSVLLISWGDPERSWTAQTANEMEQAFIAAAAMGVTVVVAAGDQGSSDGISDGRSHVDFPASAPHALACGGTTLHSSGKTIASEAVWNDLSAGGGSSGGGVSAMFSLPAYQEGVGVPCSVNPSQGVGRGVPDVASNADPATGYKIRVGGVDTVVGGTGASAALWAGLVARLNDGLGANVGFLQPVLYSKVVTETMRDVLLGTNGAYRAAEGWDPCTGWGSPDGEALLEVLRSMLA